MVFAGLGSSWALALNGSLVHECDHLGATVFGLKEDVFLQGEVPQMYVCLFMFSPVRILNAPLCELSNASGLGCNYGTLGEQHSE